MRERILVLLNEGFIRRNKTTRLGSPTPIIIHIVEGDDWESVLTENDGVRTSKLSSFLGIVGRLSQNTE